MYSIDRAGVPHWSQSDPSPEGYAYTPWPASFATEAETTVGRILEAAIGTQPFNDSHLDCGNFDVQIAADPRDRYGLSRY